MRKIFIDGQAGTTGLRIYERLRVRDDLELLELSETLRKDTAARAERINASDVTILCLPDAAAKESAALATNPNTVVIDASTAHRTNSAWAYGFPELGTEFRVGVQTKRRIAVPGCHASGFVALIRPLIQKGLLDREAKLHCLSLTGYTGGGKAMIADYESPARTRGDTLSAPRQYAFAQEHKHLPEMQAIAGLDCPPVFCPVVGDYDCGMEVTIPLHAAGFTRADAVSCYREYYASAALVRVREPDAAYAPPNAYKGVDDMDIFVEGNDARLLLIARFDNLGKGASGAAVQCLNLSIGAEETKGLVTKC